MKTLFALTLSLMVYAAIGSGMASAAPALDMNKENFNFATCTPTRFEAPHPQMTGQMIQFQIHGMVDGKCKYTQTIPGAGVVTCLFSDEQRQQIALNGMEQAGAIMQDPNTCVIVTP